MATYKAPLDDMRFVLNEVFQAEQQWADMPATAELGSDLVDAILEEAGKMAENLLLPLNRNGDEQGCRIDDGVVTTPDGFKEAFATYAENGWPSLIGDPAYGGQGMPKSLSVLFEEMMSSANTAFSIYPALSTGATLALDTHASEELKQQYLPRLYSGAWTATMCLTEAHAGTDLGIMHSRATPNDDGSHQISGTKIFITGGEHDLADNIVHLVLAKLPDAPAGSKGISLFLVPKFLPDEDGNAGQRNAVTAESIEHKMGIQGSATCVMNFDGARGWLIGEENQGLACMFTMMNQERVSIGMQGLGLGEVSYQNAADYARQRVQGRSASGDGRRDGKPDPIIVHGDIRRMLLTMRAFNEGSRALSVYVGMALDQGKFSGDEQIRNQAEDRVALLTPIAKAFTTDRGFDTTVMGQQIFGGHGYIRETGVEQFVRDARIAQIYEGTNGIQALDLAGRKVVRNDGQYVDSLLSDMRDWLTQHSGNSALEAIEQPLTAAFDRLQASTRELLRQAGDNPDAISANSVPYLDLCGYTLYAWLWARMLVTVADRDDDFARAKRTTGHFYFQRLLPQTLSLAEQIKAGPETMMALDADLF